MAREVTTVTYDDFGDGIDRRGSILTRSAKKFYTLVNYHVNEGRKLVMRPPLLQYAGVIDTVVTQGCAYLNGRLITIAQTGGAAHTVAGVDTLIFDTPEGSVGWELIRLVTYNEKVCALIRHSYPGSTLAPRRNFLHVFDGAHPTYVEDPAFPPSWSPAYPLQPYGNGVAGAYRDYTPLLEVVADRLCVSTASGDVAFCAVGLPRVWNTLSPAEILANGEMFYRILGTPTGTSWSFTLPVVYEDLTLEARYAAYVCEYLKSDGTWGQFTEVTSAGNAGEYSLASVTNRFDSTAKNETRITIKPLDSFADGQLVRFRAIADPPVVIVSGLNLTAHTVAGELMVEGGSIVGGVMVHEGKSYNKQTADIPTLTVPSQNVRVVVPIPSSPVSIPPIIGVDTAVCPLNGQQRYWSRIVADITSNDGVQEREGAVGIISGTWTNEDGKLSPHAAEAGYYTYLYSGGPGWDGALFAPNTAGLSIGDILSVGPMKVRVEGFSSASYSIYLYWGNSGRARIERGCPRVKILSGYDGLWIFGNNSGQPLMPWAEIGFNGGYTYAITGRTAITVGGTRIDGAGTKYTTDLKIGRTVEVNGESRKVISITSDTVAEVELPFTTAGSYVALRDPTYQYAYDVGDTGNEWYATKEAAITFNGAGKDDALVIGTSSYDSSGALPTAVAALQNRMLVQFPSVLQSWAVDGAVSSFRLLSVMGQGAGSNTRPMPALVDGYAALPTVNGPRLFEPTNNNKDYIDFIPCGDMLRGITLPDFTRSVWWPRMRLWVSCATASGGLFYALSVHKDAKVLAWSTFTVAGLGTVDDMFVRDNALVVRSGANLYYFDPDATTFTDVTGQYTAKARWLYNDLGAPQRNKKLVRCEIIQTGKATVNIHVNPRALNADTVGGPTVSGVTAGMQRFPVMAMGPGIGLEIESSDPTGHQLDQIGFDYTLLNR